MSHLVLSHLSRNNNKPEIVSHLFSKHAGDTTIVVASRYKESEVYYIYDDEGRKDVMPFKPLQLALFE